MTVLTSGLETFDYGTSGWSAIEKTNLELIDVDLRGPFLATKNLGEVAQADESTTQADPAAITAVALTDSTTGTATQTIADATATFSQTITNDNNASLTDEINKLKADVDELRTKLVGTIDYGDTIKAAHNALLAKLRVTGGCGILLD